MNNDREHLKVSEQEQATIVFMGLRDKLGGPILRGLIEGDITPGEELDRQPEARSESSESRPSGRGAVPTEGRYIGLDSLLEGEEESASDREPGDDYFDTTLQVTDEEVSVVLGPGSPVYALRREEVIRLIDQESQAQPGPSA